MLNRSSDLPVRDQRARSVATGQRLPHAAATAGGAGQIVSAEYEKNGSAANLAADAQSKALQPDSGVSWVRYLFQDNEAGGDAAEGAVAEPAANAPIDTTESLRQFEGVDVESLPDLDVIILRGRDQDLDQLAEIIQQLERISQENRRWARAVMDSSMGRSVSPNPRGPKVARFRYWILISFWWSTRSRVSMR